MPPSALEVSDIDLPWRIGSEVTIYQVVKDLGAGSFTVVVLGLRRTPSPTRYDPSRKCETPPLRDRASYRIRIRAFPRRQQILLKRLARDVSINFMRHQRR